MSKHYRDLSENCWCTKSDGEEIKIDIQLGRLCCFKEIGKQDIYFGHMAGKVVDDFENMTFLYVLKCDNRYFFSKEVVEKPIDVHTSNDAERYFIEKYS